MRLSGAGPGIVNLALPAEGTLVHCNRHAHSGLLHGDGRKGDGGFLVHHRVSDGDFVNAGDHHNISGEGSLDFLSPHIVEHEDFSHFGLLQRVTRLAVHDIVARFQLSIQYSSDSDLSLEVIVVDIGDQQL